MLEDGTGWGNCLYIDTQPKFNLEIQANHSANSWLAWSARNAATGENRGIWATTQQRRGNMCALHNKKRAPHRIGDRVPETTPGVHSLHEAINSRNLERVKALLEESTDLLLNKDEHTSEL